MKNYALDSISKRILGRNVENAGSTKEPVALFWGASAVEVNVKACEVWVKLSSDYITHEPWVAVEVNGCSYSRFMVPKGEPQWYCIARNLNPQKENLISILKDSQPMYGDVTHSLFVHEIGLDDEGTFLPLKERPLKIEFIGDSITSGEGLAGNPEEMDWISQWISSSKTYAVQTAHSLNADWQTFSQCGWGLCWGWDGNRNSKMPPHYEKVCSLMEGEYQEKIGAGQKYYFDKGSDFVVLNLGTNDDTAFKPDSDDGQVFTDSVVSFLKKIRSFNPKAKIVWTWGMLALKYVPAYLDKGVKKYVQETGDKQVFTLEFDSMDKVEKNPEDKGSRGHPGPKTHLLASKKLVEFLKQTGNISL